jgi:hypothetical protein
MSIKNDVIVTKQQNDKHEKNKRSNNNIVKELINLTKENQYLKIQIESLKE